MPEYDHDLTVYISSACQQQLKPQKE